MSFLIRNKTNSLTDQEVVARYKETGDPFLIGILFNRYAKLVLGLCLKYLKNEDDARDTVMQIFTELLDKLCIHDVEHFRSWLYIYSKNTCLMSLRKQNIVVPLEEYHIAASSDENDHFDIEIKEEELQMALCHLKGEQKVCIELFYLRQMSYREVAYETGYSDSQVKSHIQNGKRNLKIIMESKNIEQ